MAASLVYDYRTADLDEPDRALCDFAVRVTLRPAEMERADIDRLHAAGFDDEAITIATQVISYFNYINRVADALGVDPEPGMTPPREQWEQGRARDYSEVLG